MQKTNWLTEKIKSCMKYLIKKIGYEGFYFLSGVLMGIISRRHHFATGNRVTKRAVGGSPPTPLRGIR